MNVKFYSAAAAFLADTEEAMLQDEARYGLMLGIAKRAVENPEFYGGAAPWYCAIFSRNRLHAAAMRTPPFKVILAQFSGQTRAVAGCLLDAVSQKEKSLPGALGDLELTGAFKDLWCRRYGVAVQQTMPERLYRLEHVSDVPLAPGYLRQAAVSDKELLVKWAQSFHEEPFGESSNEPPLDIVPNIERGEIFLWEDREPVSAAARGRPTPRGIAVNFVYTSLERRRQGYATSCVTELCRRILQDGYRFCMLFADASNPVSKSIYQKIGFYGVCDILNYEFTLPPAADTIRFPTR
jgi:predicted GNAT family acetyltransferase